MVRAAIDLGTNTFHLLIGEVKDGRIITRVKERRYVFIGQHGLNTIPEEVIQRAEQVLHEFGGLIHLHQATGVKAVVTESLRTASNSTDILVRWQNVLGYPIELISGMEEASLAGAAVIYGTEGLAHRSIAVDIGGGSVELILIEGQKIKDARSIICGISVLHRAFHKTDPISSEDLREMTRYLDEVLLQPLRDMEITPPLTLVGIAGSFEVLPTSSNWGDTHCRIIDTQATQKWYEELAVMREAERKRSNYIPSERGQYIVEALAIIQTLIQSGLFDLHLTCPYSLKEGLLLNH
jgi:exopolyphosphatase/guanosine-5'-triphosphate,3'-diphosphate pyrophosphatase